MGDDGINEHSEDAGVDEVGPGAGALSHRARDDGHGLYCEGPLDEPHFPSVRKRSRTSLQHRSTVLDVARAVNADGKVVGADEAAAAAGGAVRHAVADEPENQGTKRGIDHVFEEDVGRVLGVDDACLEHGKSALHEEDEGGCQRRGQA